MLFAQGAPAGYVVPPVTLSPDHRYGVAVPAAANADTIANPEDSVIDTSNGSLVGAITSEEVAYDHVNDGEIDPTLWTADDSMLLWQVDGKWGFDDEILVKIANGRIASQADVLNSMQQEMLTRTRSAVPDKYAAVKAQNADWGSWYKDGFSIDCVLAAPSGPLTFPLHYQCYLTSDPKNSDGAAVNARMTAEVNADGTVKVTDFHLGTNPPARNW